MDPPSGPRKQVCPACPSGSAGDESRLRRTVMTMGFLILHGIENHRPPEHWQFLLAARLVERGHEVRYPALPEPDAPQLERWLDVLDEELSALGGEQRVVVCHSLACLLWFRAAECGLWAAGPVDRLLLVSPPASECLPDGGASFRLEAFDAGSVRPACTGRSPSGSPPRCSRARATSRRTRVSVLGRSRLTGAWPPSRGHD